MLKTFYIKALVLFALVIAGQQLISPYFIKYDINSFKQDEYRELEGEVAIGIFGSSHGINGIDPRLIELETGLKTINFSQEGQRLVSTYAAAKQILKENELKLVVLDIFFGTTEDIPKSSERALFFQYNTLDYLPLNWNKFSIHNEIYGLGALPNMFPSMRNHSRWKSWFVDEKEFNVFEGNDYYQGFLSSFYYDAGRYDKDADAKRKQPNRDQETRQLKESEIRNIERMLELFNSYNVPVVIVSTPFEEEVLGNKNSSHQELLMNYLKEKDLTVIDFNLLEDELNIELDDFRDAGHMNTQGAAKISEHLANVIRTELNSEIGGDVSDNSKNRYAMINNSDQDPLIVKVFDSLQAKSVSGIEKITVFNTFGDNYEVLLELAEYNLEKPRLQFEYRYPVSEESLLPPNSNKLKIADGKITETSSLLRNEVRYRDKNLIVQRFKIPFSEISDLRISLLTAKGNTELVTFKELNLK